MTKTRLIWSNKYYSLMYRDADVINIGIIGGHYDEYVIRAAPNSEKLLRLVYNCVHARSIPENGTDLYLPRDINEK